MRSIHVKHRTSPNCGPFRLLASIAHVLRQILLPERAVGLSSCSQSASRGAFFRAWTSIDSTGYASHLYFDSSQRETVCKCPGALVPQRWNALSFKLATQASGLTVNHHFNVCLWPSNLPVARFKTCVLADVAKSPRTPAGVTRLCHPNLKRKYPRPAAQAFACRSTPETAQHVPPHALS